METKVGSEHEFIARSGHEKLICCEDMGRAMQDGNDAEYYGPLIVIVDGAYVFCGHEDGARKGYLPALQLCPWCGTRLEPSDSDASG